MHNVPTVAQVPPSIPKGVSGSSGKWEEEQVLMSGTAQTPMMGATDADESSRAWVVSGLA
jgi:hypothetical protein